ncbi:MAG TPA: hypothetical protein VGB16_02170 [candidate division Zixibacteria bacterium]
MDVANSVNGVPIRLTEKRWFHVVENHDDLAGHYDDVLNTLENPDFVLRGYKSALIAIKGIAKGRYLAVVYKELKRDDGFVLSAYITTKIRKRLIIWRKEN